ncbi:MAG: tRNA adenosine(34) deaminase TadA [Lachnospiraceae bacterium]|jgi:tRNA(adenine34) deaminase|nr:tRNA adenosine(34) deaminase TadA [Lachnospiraceae bacterium]
MAKMTEDEIFMKEALKQAKKAYALEETPIGCVIVQEGTIIARGYNRRNTEKSGLAHAELLAIRKANRKTGDWRLEDCTLYVTLEPCQMCAGAIVQSRIRRVVIGAMNPKAGCAGSVLNLLQMQEFNHQVEIEQGVLQEECSGLLSEFFRELRARKAELKAAGSSLL